MALSYYFNYFCGMLSIEEYQKAFLEFLERYNLSRTPETLYKPIDYILNLGGKRLRPVLTLMTADVFDGAYKDAFNAALAIEVFHNFTLIHDDIMDDAPLRRGKETVHEKWDLNTGILSGDAMLILAYRLFEAYDANTFKHLLQLFSQTALEVCEGQQYDIDFETRDNVTVPEYLKMIEYKTSVLLAAAMKMGAIVAKTSEANQDKIYEFGKNLGIAFQLQDDYLDTFGDPKTFGKQIGGDIMENKKTYLYLKALEFCDADSAQQLQYLFEIQPTDQTEKVETVKQLFASSGAVEATQKAIEEYTNKAFGVLETITISDDRKAVLRQFGEQLMKRTV